MKRIALFIVIALAAISCASEEVIAPEIKVLTEEADLVLPPQEGIIPIAFNVNVDWTAEIKEPEAKEWCTFSPAKGGKPGDNILNIICIENKGVDNRTATVLIKALDVVQEVVVTQLQKDVLVITADKEYNIPYQGDTLIFEVAHNLDLKVRPDVDWIKEVKTKALTEETVAYVVEFNEGEERTGKITFTADPFKEEIVINQAPWVLEFTVDPAEDKAFDAAGGDHKITVDANVPYTVNVEEVDWLKMSVDDNEYVFTADPNTDLKARQTTVRIAPKSAKYIQAAKSIVISQKGKGAKLTPSASEFSLTCLEQTFELSVEANIKYEMAYKKSVDGVYVDVDPAENWLTHTVSDDVYTFSALVNDSWEERSMVLLFTPVDAAYSDMVTAVVVRQYGHAFKMWSYQIASIDGYDSTKHLRLALYNDKLLLANTTKVFVLNPATGAVENTILLPDGVLAHSLLVDDAGNLLVAENGLGGTEGTGDDAVIVADDMTLYYIADLMNPTLEEVLTYNTGSFYGAGTGNFRVRGDIKNNAVITATVYSGGGGAGLVWEVKNGVCGDYALTNVPYEGSSACTMPLSADLEDGLYYIGYGGERNLMYAETPVMNPQKDENGNYVNPTNWITAFDTKTDSNYNFNCISIMDWKGKKYAGILRGSHFNYCNTDMILLDIDTPSAAVKLYEHLGEFDVPRSDAWANLWWTGGGAYSDIILIPTDDALLMIGADSNYGTITCVTIM